MVNIKVCIPLKQCSDLKGNYHAPSCFRVCHYSYNIKLNSKPGEIIGPGSCKYSLSFTQICEELKTLFQDAKNKTIHCDKS